MEEYYKLKEAQYQEGQKELENTATEDPISSKFRMTHKASQFSFSKQDKMETVFKFVNCCLRDGF